MLKALYFSLSSGMQCISFLNSSAISLIIKWSLCTSLCLEYLKLHNECASPLYIPV